MCQNIGRWESELLNARLCETYGINFDQITSYCDCLRLKILIQLNNLAETRFIRDN